MVVASPPGRSDGQGSSLLGLQTPFPLERKHAISGTKVRSSRSVSAPGIVTDHTPRLDVGGVLLGREVVRSRTGGGTKAPDASNFPCDPRPPAPAFLAAGNTGNPGL